MLKGDDKLESQERALTTAERASEMVTRSAKAVATSALRSRMEVFVLRASNTTYMWEIRRNGSTTLHQSPETFPTISLARSAGEVALVALLS